MRIEDAKRGTLNTVAEVAKALATAFLSLALGATLCLALVLGGTALAAN